ncbi:MAG: cytosine deaminase [Thermostichales cyanobacterium SRBZ-1_bins_19]
MGLWLLEGRVPACLLDEPIGIPDREGLLTVSVKIEGGKIAHLQTQAPEVGEEEVWWLRGGMIWPCFVDAHTHLDKGHIWPRRPNRSGTFAEAIAAVNQDYAYWTAADLYARMNFALRCSYAHGTQAIRTHLDCGYGQSWPGLEVWQQLRQEWLGKITLQAVSIADAQVFLTPLGEAIADQLAAVGGILGAVLYPHPELPQALERIVDLAAERGMDLDFHCDETGDPESLTVAEVARWVLRKGFSGQVVCGHCCSLSVQDPQVLGQELIPLLKEAGLGIISLPMCNLYLQDRQQGRTPRWRGIAPIQELAQAGIPVAIASDNCRDPFYGFGDHDMAEVVRMAVRIGHLDSDYGFWPRAFTSTPAALMGLAGVGKLAVGMPADLVVFRGRNYSEWLSRSQHDRRVIRGGKLIDSTLPDYEELDYLVIA